jgi:hypothetical protein
VSGAEVNRLVGQLVRVRELDPARFEEILLIPIKPTGGNQWWTFHEFELVHGPFAKGELRLHVDRTKALVSLYPREDKPLLDAGIDRAQWGDLKGMDVNPRIPPEGTDAYIYDVLGVKVSFQFLHHSRKLRSIALEWGVMA